MEPEQLRKLIFQPEGPNLEFKRQLHQIYHADSKVKDSHCDELVRDILALANNNTTTAGEEAYLIFGADDKLTNGSRELFDVDGRIPSPSDILDKLRAASYAPLPEITAEPVKLDGKRLFVITIMPDTFLHETNRKLTISNRTTYSEHIVFIRQNESVQIASAKERAAILELRKKRVAEKNTPLTLFGTILGAIVGGPLLMRMSEKTMPDVKYNKLGGGLVGSVVFGALGGVAANALKTIIEIKSDWRGRSIIQKGGAIIFLATIPIAIIWMFLGQMIDIRIKK